MLRDTDEKSLFRMNAIAINVVCEESIFAPMAIHPVLPAKVLQFSIIAAVVIEL